LLTAPARGVELAQTIERTNCRPWSASELSSTRAVHLIPIVLQIDDVATTIAGVSYWITMVGPVLHDRLKIWMNFADAFILTSPSKMACRRCCWRRFMPEHRRSSPALAAPATLSVIGIEALLIPPRSVEAIEQAIGRLINDPASSRAMAERGHR